MMVNPFLVICSFYYSILSRIFSCYFCSKRASFAFLGAYQILILRQQLVICSRSKMYSTSSKQKGYQRSDALAAWSLVANLHYSLLIARKRSERACAAAHHSFSMTLSSLRLSIQWANQKPTTKATRLMSTSTAPVNSVGRIMMMELTTKPRMSLVTMA